MQVHPSKNQDSHYFNPKTIRNNFSAITIFIDTVFDGGLPNLTLTSGTYKVGEKLCEDIMRKGVKLVTNDISSKASNLINDPVQAARGQYWTAR